MSTVADIYSFIQYRRDIQVTADDLIHIVNGAVRTISKRLYQIGSDLITGQMSVGIFASVNTYELMTLDVAPATAWAAGDTITGVTSGETCVIKSVITTKTFYVDERSGNFTLNEILTNGTYTADQGAANPTFTSLMVLVDSNPDTITYAANQFVVEGFQAGMPVTTSHASNTGTYHVETVAAGTLTMAAVDSLTAATSVSFIVTSDDSFGYLPSDFWGLRDKPYLAGKTYPLLPLPSQDVALAYPGAGEPIYYKIVGTRIYVTPHTAADYTIKGDYFQRPTALTVSTSTIPYNELFDDLISEYVVRYFRGKEGNKGEAEVFLSKDLISGVDLIANQYDRKAPVQFPQAVNWGF